MGQPVCNRVQMGQVPPIPVNFDVLLGPIVAPPPPDGNGTTPVYRTTVTDLAERNPPWLWLVLGALGLLMVAQYQRYEPERTGRRQKRKRLSADIERKRKELRATPYF